MSKPEQGTDCPPKGGDKGHSKCGAKLANEAYSMHRPSAPHYVGQDKYDTAHGVLDLYDNNQKGAETQFKSSIGDLKKESTLISSSEKQGQSALNDIEKGGKNSKADVIKELDGLIKGLDKNYYNSSDDKDFKAALKAAQSGNLDQAGSDILKGETTLHNKATNVSNSSTDMQAALKATESGNTQAAETAANKSVADLKTGSLESQKTKPKAQQS